MKPSTYNISAKRKLVAGHRPTARDGAARLAGFDPGRRSLM
jgi:hypothetical protein